MPRFAANLTMLFTEVPFLDRFERAAKAGFKAVEFLFPYPFAAADIRSRIDANGLQIVLHNLPAGDWDAGERGIACLPDRVDEFRAGVGKAIVARLARKAFDLGGRRLWLLTATAEPFFEAIKFKRVDRANAPASILATRQAQGLCPASAAVLTRPIYL